MLAVPALGFDDDFRIGATDGQALIAELAFEALIVAVLLGLAGVDEHRFYFFLAEPL